MPVPAGVPEDVFEPTAKTPLTFATQSGCATSSNGGKDLPLRAAQPMRGHKAFSRRADDRAEIGLHGSPLSR